MDQVVTPTAPAALSDPVLFINREASWLSFNDRVLAQATGTDHPLLERVKFLSIVGTNLEEFFMIRVATLLRKARAGLNDSGVDGLNTNDALAMIRERATAMLNAQALCWNDTLKPLLREQGIHVLEMNEWTPAVTEFLEKHFAHEISPALTPLAFDPGHPFPFISNLSQNMAVVVRHGGKTRFARVKIPQALPRFIPIPAPLTPAGVRAFAYAEDVIRANVQSLFPGTVVKGAHLFRVVRDADIVIQEDEADDLLESVDQGLKQRRHGALAMLLVEANTPRRVLDILMENFDLDEARTYRTDHRLGFADWAQLADNARPELRYPPLVQTAPWPPDADEEIFEELRHHDRLVHHPFESFSAVEAFIRAAVIDPHVVAIKITLYRIGTNSPLVDLLVDAAEAGKQVAVLVELKARFDEQNNIKWATRLEAAGAHVAYGLVNLKTHAKVCLIVRQEADGIRSYVHIGTGNYNAGTARGYTDVGLFTSRASIVEDAAQLFNTLTGYSNHREYRDFLTAPFGLRAGVLALIEHEAAEAREGRPARIIIKLNALTDPECIRALYRASMAGVSIELIVRGVCSLTPGVPGVSDNITVRSIVGRFLEHSRIFWFQNGQTPRVLIGSADLMERNLDRRVEVLCPIYDRRIAEHLRTVVLGACLQDTRRAWQLGADGRYQTVPSSDADGPSIDSQELLAEWYAVDRKSRE